MSPERATKQRLPVRVLAGVLVVALYLVSGPAAMADQPKPGGASKLGPPPLDCAAAHLDFTNLTCTTASRNGTFTFDQHEIHAGETLTGKVSGECKKHPGGDFGKPATEQCPITWTDVIALGQVVSGCAPTNMTCTVRIAKDAASTAYRVIEVGIKSDQGTGVTRDYVAIIGGDWYVLGGHIVGRDGKPYPKVVNVYIAGPTSLSVTSDETTGLYTALLKKGTYTVTTAGGIFQPVETDECKVTGSACQINLIQDRTADFELPGPPLLMEVSLGPIVHGHTYHGTAEKPVAKAGTAIVIKVTLRNTSRTKTIVVYGDSLWAQISGNAFDGHLQAATAPVYDLGKPDADTIALSPDVRLKPKESRDFAFVVRTRTLNTNYYAQQQAAQGGAPPTLTGNTTTPAHITIVQPVVAVMPKGAKGDLANVKASDVKVLTGDNGTELKGTTEYTVPIDDADPPPVPWDPTIDRQIFAERIAAQVPAAMLSWTWGAARGLVWDLPNASASWYFGLFYEMDHETAYWSAMDSGPEGRAMYVRYAKAVSARLNKEEHAEAQYRADHSPGALARIEDALRQHWTGIAEEYYHGDWLKAADAMSTDGTHAFLDVVTAVAPGSLARLPGIARLSAAFELRKITQALQKAIQAEKTLNEITMPLLEAAEAANPAEKLRLVGEVERAVATLENLPSKTPLTANQMLDLGGITPEEGAVMDAVGAGVATEGRPIVQFWKPRGKFAGMLKGLLGKPSWIHPKGITFEDVKYLGESVSDLGKQVWTEPPFLELVRSGHRAEAESQYLAELKQWFQSNHQRFTPADAKAASERWAVRIDEWTSQESDQVHKLVQRASTAETNNATTSVVFDVDGSLRDSSIKLPEYQVNFKIESSMTGAKDPFGNRRRYTPYANNRAGDPLTRIRSDNDALYFMYATGEELTDADRLRVYKYFSERGIIAHPDTGSYAITAVREKILTDKTLAITRGVDGKWYITRYNARVSDYKNPGNIRHIFDGYDIVPGAP